MAPYPEWIHRFKDISEIVREEEAPDALSASDL